MISRHAGALRDRSRRGTATGPAHASRRGFLRRLTTILGVLTLSRCAPDGPGGPALEIGLDSIPQGGRLRALLGDEPVELRRDGAEVRARSLLCTHMGCELSWNESSHVYDCPCHEGSFSAEGLVLGGPPLEPLRELPVRVEAERVTVTAAGTG